MLVPFTQGKELSTVFPTPEGMGILSTFPVVLFILTRYCNFVKEN